MALTPGGPQFVTPNLPTLYFPHPKVLIILIGVFFVGHIRHAFQSCSSFIHSVNIFYLDAMSRHFDVSRARDYF